MPRRAPASIAGLSPNLTMLAEGVSFIGSVAILLTLTALTAAGLWIGGRPRAALMLASPSRWRLILNNVVKLAFARARPEAFFGDLRPTATASPAATRCSRPATSASSPASSPPTSRRIGSAPSFGCSPAAIIAGIGLSRIYLGVHYLTDVIAGFALAALIVCIVRSIVAEQR